jgi:hypothetical protein
LEGGFPVFLRRAYLWLSGGGAPILGATRSGDDREGALVGRPVRGPRRLGPWTLPSGDETTASLLDARCVSLDTTHRPEPALALGAPSAETLGEEFAWSAAAFFALALALEVLTGLREFGAALPRRARAV